MKIRRVPKSAVIRAQREVIRSQETLIAWLIREVRKERKKNADRK